MSPVADDEFQTKREAELRWQAHTQDHIQLAESIRTAIEAVDRERVLHVTAHDAAHAAHNREHSLDEKASSIALSAHAREHTLEAGARDKAEQAIDTRLQTMNEFRGQLKDQATTFARVETVHALTDRIIAIEKLDIKGEGKAIGQGTVVVIIVGVVSFIGTILGILIMVSNFATKA